MMDYESRSARKCGVGRLLCVILSMNDFYLFFELLSDFLRATLCYTKYTFKLVQSHFS
jgi:hypothetical protein